MIRTCYAFLPKIKTCLTIDPGFWISMQKVDPDKDPDLDIIIDPKFGK